MKKNMTRMVHIEAHPQDISGETVSFIENNLKKYPGKTSLRFILNEPRNKMKVTLATMNGGFEMNEEMIEFLESRPELEVQVVTG
jgi:DNA polymerase-3 subunit alpha